MSKKQKFVVYDNESCAFCAALKNMVLWNRYRSNDHCASFIFLYGKT